MLNEETITAELHFVRGARAKDSFAFLVTHTPLNFRLDFIDQPVVTPMSACCDEFFTLTIPQRCKNCRSSFAGRTSVEKFSYAYKKPAEAQAWWEKTAGSILEPFEATLAVAYWRPLVEEFFTKLQKIS